MIVSLAKSDQTIGDAYNIGNEEEEITMGELAQKIVNIMKKNVKINALPSTSGSPERRCPSIAKLKKAVSFVKQYSLDKGLKETFDWYNANVFSGQNISAI